MAPVSKLVKKKRLCLLLARAAKSSAASASPGNQCANVSGQATTKLIIANPINVNSQPFLIRPITVGLQQPNLNQDNPKALHCLLCFKETTQNLTSLTNCTEKEADFLVIFLLKKMLGVSNKNLVQYLRTLGHPRGWVSICETCSPLVTGAFTVQKQISELEVKLRVFQKKMKEKIVSRNLEMEIKIQSDDTTATIPNCVPNPIPFASNQTRDYVGELELINNLESISTTQAKRGEAATLTVPTSTPSEAENLSVVSSWECGGYDFSEPFKNLPIMSTTPTNALTEPSSKSSNTTRRNKRKQTFTVKIEELNEKGVVSSYVKCRELEDATVEGDDETKLSMMSKLMKFKQAHPNDEVVYNCAMCPNLKSMRLRSFVKHLVYHFDRPYQCNECSAYFTGEDTELAKWASENQSGSHVCRRETLEKVKLMTSNIWDCGYCSEAFQLESERELHEKSAHSNKVPIPLTHYCNRCPKKFRDYPEWQIHRALEHPDLAKLGCFYCDATFKYKLKEDVDVADLTARTKHIKEHHGQKYYTVEPFECRICGANFNTANRLESHSRIEHGKNWDKLYWCPVCFDSGRSRVAMQTHIAKFVHRQNPGERLICDICAYGTARNSILAEHRFLAHGVEPENKGAKIFSCTVEGCSFKCLFKGTFDTHMMKVHNAERRIKCKICGRGFITTTHCKRHERTHGSAKPYQCEICGNSFAVRNYLYIHMRLSHLNRPFASTNRRRTPRKPVVPNPVESSTSNPPLNSSL